MTNDATTKVGTPPAEIVTATPEPPAAPDFSGMSLSEYETHLKQKADGATPPEPTKTEPTKAEATPPKPEDEDEPEISAEIDKAEPPPADETAQNKSARTKRNRRKAQKAYATRVTRERDEARQEIQRLTKHPGRRDPEPKPARSQAPPADTYTGIDPKDPVPKQESFNGDDHAYFRRRWRMKYGCKGDSTVISQIKHVRARPPSSASAQRVRISSAGLESCNPRTLSMSRLMQTSTRRPKTWCMART